ncbi:NAD(P)-dependent alcohol dehydrogenase [uncultured Cellulomonas sp.]|uniref:NAD(P)-dependent alcohol dehydrogenase n=1 Tax=uncultured Cellulomonas sp. TaxID=189682 RepID=UPI0026345C0C|nr:NAD(P)-dependent alcohol dehydrogenase [uncultured Cellulomonas sp.]
MPTRMRAVTQDRYGDADALSISDEPTPTAGPGEVLLEVNTAGVDRGVWHLMTGLPYLTRLLGYGLRRPAQRVPGMDVAGRVVAIGQGVTDLAVGDEVFGIGIGTFAEYARARVDKLVRKPAGLSFDQAAVVAISGLTAHQGLHKAGQVRAGQSVLVLGASGGVGSHVVQLARAAGAEVTGVASGAKGDLVRALGAHRVLDYTTTDPTDGSARYDLIIDTGGRTPVRRLRRALTSTGTLVIVGGEGGGRFTGGFGRQLRALALSPFVSQRLTSVMSKEHRDGLEPLVAAIEAGELTPAVGRCYALDQVPQAIRDLADGRARGKSVIRVRAAG